MITTHFTTISPSKSHIQAPLFRKIPSKNTKTPRPKKISLPPPESRLREGVFQKKHEHLLCFASRLRPLHRLSRWKLAQLFNHRTQNIGIMRRRFEYCLDHGVVSPFNILREHLSQHKRTRSDGASQFMFNLLLVFHIADN